MNSSEIANLYNNDGLSLSEIGEKIGKSKSTVQRILVNDGWSYDKKSKKYFNENNPIKQDNNTSNKIVSRETIKIVNRTYGIPSDVDRALKIMCALEGRNAVDVVREALRNSINKKYFNYK